MSKQAPVCDIDFYGSATIANPVSAYAAMLKLGPVVWLNKNNLHAICGHAELVSVLRNHQCFGSGKGVSINDDVNQLIVGSTLNSDRPQHDHTRQITFAPLSPRHIGDVRERIESEAEALAESMLRKTQFDAAVDLAPHLPLSVVRDLVGLGDYGKEHMLDWGAATFELMGEPGNRKENAIASLRRMRRFLEDPDILQNLSDDGWAKRATRLGIESGMQPKRAAELMRDYIAPSLDTTISAIGFAIKLFAEYPEQWTKLRENRSLMKNAIEEIVRLNTPIRAFTRYAYENTEIEGVKLTEGERILVVFGAANRDAKKFSNPNEFNIERKTTGHVGFGHGVHMCLGMNLARLEMDCLFNALADRVKRFELIGPIVTQVNSTIYSLRSVPVRAVT
ncbi:MAG: cytochrome P450 [Gammaproteobacteria bacterium]|nr:cytochrome P450 [Gammaproteobacteria bacterium]